MSPRVTCRLISKSGNGGRPSSGPIMARFGGTVSASRTVTAKPATTGAHIASWLVISMTVRHSRLAAVRASSTIGRNRHLNHRRSRSVAGVLRWAVGVGRADPDEPVAKKRWCGAGQSAGPSKASVRGAPSSTALDEVVRVAGFDREADVRPGGVETAQDRGGIRGDEVGWQAEADFALVTGRRHHAPGLVVQRENLVGRAEQAFAVGREAYALVLAVEEFGVDSVVRGA